MTSLFNVLLVYLFSIELALTENCQEIIDSEVKSGIESERSSGDGVPLTVTLYKWNINCQTVGTVKGTFGSLSISAFYLNNGNSMNETGRIAFDCIQESDVVFEWRADTLLFLGNTEDVGLLTGDTLTNCSSCRGVNNYECIACDSSCNEGGFGYCTSSSSADCCSYYNENMCVAVCPANHISDSSFDCICEDFYQETECTVCTLQQSDCENGGISNTATCACGCDGTGYSDRLCTADVNECNTTNPCDTDNTVSCTNSIGSYTCTCKTGFDGKNCENNINDCQDDSCSFGGTCNDGVASFTCTCAPGYTGDICTIDIDECEEDPCVNGGVCEDRVNDYYCQCVPQYKGKDCEMDVNECELSQPPCLNEGICQNNVGGYTCDCVGRWINPTCDVCAINNCISTSCNGSRYKCLECIDRYTPISTDQSSCVLCTIGNCTSCSGTNVCVSCAHNLVTNGTICQPRPDNRKIGSLDYGSFSAIIIALIAIIALIVVSIIIITIIALRIRAKKPIQYGAKNPIEHKDPIVLKLQSQI